MFARAFRKMRLLKRFGRARKGSAAVEFALVALPFFMLTVGLAEISLIGFAQTSLDLGVSEASRQIRTGRAQLGGVSEADIRNQICGEMNSLMMLTCDNNLFIDVDRFSSFIEASNAEANPIQNNEFQAGGFGYTPGNASDIVVVRAYYRWKILTPLFEPIFQNVNGGHRILVSTLMFRNEPYQ